MLMQKLCPHCIDDTLKAPDKMDSVMEQSKEHSLRVKDFGQKLGSASL
jgi:hypothetical protein